jgi:hypothetical protein
MLSDWQQLQWNKVYPQGTVEEIKHWRRRGMPWVVDTWLDDLVLSYYEYGWIRVFYNFLKLLQEE